MPLPFFAALLVVTAAAPAAAESALRLSLPPGFGEIPASTFDRESGERVGGGFIEITREADGGVRMEGLTGIDGGAQTRVTAVLAPADGGLQLLRQESRSLDVEGNPMGTLVVDHVAGEGRCTTPGRDGEPAKTETIALDARDRVSNVAMILFFLPIVRGETEELKFQILLCGDGPRIVTAVARPVPGGRTARGAELVRVRYELDLPRLLARVVQRWLPRLSFWFDAAADGRWIGHEMPLYSKGPTVLMAREGFTPALLDGESGP